MKIGFVTVFDSSDPQSWSGLNFGIRDALVKAGADVIPIDNLRHGRSISRAVSKLVSKYFYKKSHDHFWAVQTARAYSFDVTSRLRSESVDVVVASSNMPVSFAHTDVPIAVWGDAVFDSLFDFYPQFSSNRLSPLSVHAGKLIDQVSLSKVNQWAMSSRWAAQSVCNLGPRNANVSVVPYGANINLSKSYENNRNSRKLIPNKIDMVWVGVDWHRKRGDFVIEILHEVRKHAPESTLTIIGCEVPEELRAGYIVNIPYINKGIDRDCITYNEILATSHVMLIPSLADCCAVVGVEACKTGLPSLVCNVGGQSDIIPESNKECLLSTSSTASAWAKVILDTCASQDQYDKLQAYVVDHYHDWFDWSLNSNKLLSLVSHLR